MKKLLALCLVTIGLGIHAAQAEVINNFNTQIKVQPDASLLVQEQIDYDFGSEQRHGIYRDIKQSQDNDDGYYRLDIAAQSVTDENGQAYQYSTEANGNYLRIKIGDADQTISGRHQYTINYSVKGAVNNFADHDELYWNATGEEWQVPIKQASATIVAPTGANFKLTNCYWGAAGSTANCQHQFSSSSATFSQASLSAGQGMTIVGGWDKGFVTPTDRQLYQHKKFNSLPWEIASLIIPIAIVAFLFRTWYRIGRDAKSKLPVVAAYGSPDKLSPAELNFLNKNTLEQKGLTAEIIQLAVLGQLTIERKEKLAGLKTSYTLKRLAADQSQLSATQVKFFNDLFGIQVSLEEHLKDDKTQLSTAQVGFLKQVIDSKLPKNHDSLEIGGKNNNQILEAYNNLSKNLAQDLATKGYYVSNPKKIVSKYIALCVLLFVLGFIMFFGVWFISGVIYLVSAAIAMTLTLLLPALSTKGADTKKAIEGLELYLTVAEKDRLNFHNAPEKTPTHFEKLLPYAIALGVEKKWATQFANLTMSSPSWYHDSNMTAFNAVIFANSMHDFGTQSAASVYGAASGGSGASGGFSGGGGSGGGGGSW